MWIVDERGGRPGPGDPPTFVGSQLLTRVHEGRFAALQFQWTKQLQIACDPDTMGRRYKESGTGEIRM